MTMKGQVEQIFMKMVSSEDLFCVTEAKVNSEMGYLLTAKN